MRPPQVGAEAADTARGGHPGSDQACATAGGRPEPTNNTTHRRSPSMKSFSISTKLWLPVIVLAVVVVLMTAVSATRTKGLQAQAQISQQEQQSKFELSLRWRG